MQCSPQTFEAQKSLCETRGSWQVDMAEARKLSQQQRSVASGLKDAGLPGAPGADMPQTLRRVYQPLKVGAGVVLLTHSHWGGMMGGFSRGQGLTGTDKPQAPHSVRVGFCTAQRLAVRHETRSSYVVPSSSNGLLLRSPQSWLLFSAGP